MANKLQLNNKYSKPTFKFTTPVKCNNSIQLKELQNCIEENRHNKI